MILQDRILTCRDCGRQFAFSAGEQEFYRSRGLMAQGAVKRPGCGRPRVRPGRVVGDKGYSSGASYRALWTIAFTILWIERDH